MTKHVLLLVVLLAVACCIAGGSDAGVDSPANDGYRGASGPAPARGGGSLLLNMLIKNEEDHLRRSLPEWAKIVDYWIVGVGEWMKGKQG